MQISSRQYQLQYHKCKKVFACKSASLSTAYDYCAK
ncbi:hypothetical protein [Caudoviricetes sp.]|nr:hypothetical protein [Caudoviricetes sp.]